MATADGGIVYVPLMMMSHKKSFRTTERQTTVKIAPYSEFLNGRFDARREHLDYRLYAHDPRDTSWQTRQLNPETGALCGNKAWVDAPQP